MYVDNLVTRASTTTKANYFHGETKRIFNQASMNIRQWSSKEAEVMESFDEKD